MLSRRTTPLILILSLLLLPLSAASYQEIMDGAKAISPQVRNAELAYENQQLTIEKNDIEDTVTVTVTSGDVTVRPLNNNTPTTTGAVTYVGNLSATPKVTVVLPGEGSTTLTGSIGLAYDFENFPEYYRYTPSLGASHTFNLTGYTTDELEALQKAQNILSSEQTYQNSLLSFESNVLSALKAIVTAEKEVASQEKSIADDKRELENKLALGTMSEGTVLHRQSVNQIALKENTLSAQKRSLENAKAQFRTLAGVEWDGLTEIPQADLTFTVLEMGNTAVLLKQIAAEIAADNVRSQQATDNPQNLVLSGNITGTFASRTTSSQSIVSGKTNTVDGSVTTTYNAGNWNASAKVGLQYTQNATNQYSPYITVAGTWSNKSTSTTNKTEREKEIEMMRLNNALITAENEYHNQMTSYLESAQALELKILQYSYKSEQQQATTAYLLSELEYQQELFDAGLATSAAVETAAFNVSQDEYDVLLLAIEGLQLENEIKVLSL